MSLLLKGKHFTLFDVVLEDIKRYGTGEGVNSTSRWWTFHNTKVIKCCFIFESWIGSVFLFHIFVLFLCSSMCQKQYNWPQKYFFLLLPTYQNINKQLYDLIFMSNFRNYILSFHLPFSPFSILLKKYVRIWKMCLRRWNNIM